MIRINPHFHDRHNKAPVIIEITGVFWRRERDLNPRAGTTDLLVFEARPFSHLGISPQRVYFSIIETHTQEKKVKAGIPAFTVFYFFLIFESTNPSNRINTMTDPTNNVVRFVI